ncbi:SRPBCC family protein [Streptomyces sp. NPDC005373]|uniref:SRPBCC family protein n=1 Tax=Streptomyces sp. NPDC005373 TaxID=3156879 RepID=UPI0033AE92EA
MKLENTLSVPAAVGDAWKVLLDVERVAPCVPGATLTSSDGGTHHGRIKVKLGPIALTYQGTVTFLTRDEQAKVVVLEAGGREVRGNGTAKARVTCRLADAGPDRTDVHVETELTVTGKPAQFGRGALAEVSGALMDRFAENLAAELTAKLPSATESSPPFDLIDVSGASTLKRIAPIALAAALALLIGLGRRHRR